MTLESLLDYVSHDDRVGYVFVESSNDVHDMMKVAYVLPKCRFISVSVNFGQTLYVLFLGKVMPNFCKRV